MVDRPTSLAQCYAGLDASLHVLASASHGLRDVLTESEIAGNRS